MSKKNKETAKQRAARLEAEAAREEKRLQKEQRASALKKVGIAIVCVVFALALALPTVALSVLGGN